MFWLTFHTPRALRPKTDKIPADQHESRVQPFEEPLEDDIWVVCRHCGQRLTRPGERISVGGAHSHTFANPTGVVYEIGCYRMVTGCSLIGPPSYEFPWFSGHSWQIAICANCQVHLGWLFREGEGRQFFGLIIERISEVLSHD
jgi:hypothetical protein